MIYDHPSLRLYLVGFRPDYFTYFPQARHVQSCYKVVWILFFCCPNKALCTTQAISQAAWCKRPQSHCIPLPVLRGESYGECLLVVPGPIWFWSPQPASHQDLKRASPFPLKAQPMWETAFSCFSLLQKGRQHYEAGQPNAQFSHAALTSKDIPVLHSAVPGRGCTQLRNRAVVSRGAASSGLPLGSDRAAWDESESAKRTGSYSGALLEDTLAQLWTACVTHQSMCDPSECVWLCCGAGTTRGCRTELWANASMGWAKRGVWWASPS